ncbi:MAG TPA: helix-turn-helix domain-containing protein [Candidatus Limnocylindrales bacterium]
MARRAVDESQRRSKAFPPVRVVSGPAFELVAEIAAFTSGPARASLDSGKAWIREVRRLAGPELIARVECYTLGVYAELASVALESAPPRGVAELAGTLEALDAEALRLRLLGADSPLNLTMVSEGALERAVSGDSAARAEVRTAMAADPTGRQALERLIDGRADVLKAEFRSVVAGWAERVFPAFEPVALAAIERDRAAKEAQLRQSSGRAVLAAATSGVSFNPSPWITEIAIVPTVALRPFIVPTELRSTAVFLCSVADEALDVDPTAPPRRLVKVAAALGDELRMRMLRLLRDEELSASEIAARLGVERASIHHHLGILRSAGLLAISDEGERGWRYALRNEGLSAVGAGLDAYLGPRARMGP